MPKEDGQGTPGKAMLPTTNQDKRRIQLKRYCRKISKGNKFAR